MNPVKDFNYQETDIFHYFNNYFINTWMGLYKTKVKGHQDFLGLIQFYKALSVMAMKNNIFYCQDNDLRLFTIVFSNAGSGKGMTNDLYYKIFNNLIKIKTIKNPTNEKLVGSWNSKIHEINLKNKRLPGDKLYMDPKIPGYFEDYDDIVIDEAMHIFENKPAIQATLRCVADNYGNPSNFLSSETLKNVDDEGYFAKACWSTFSYHASDIKKQGSDIINNGIYQRSLTLFLRLDEDQVDDVLTSNNNMMPEETQQYNKTIKQFSNQVSDLFEFYKDTSIVIQEKTYKFLNDEIMQRRAFLGTMLNGEEKIVLDSYIIRGKVNAIKIACINAVINERETYDRNGIQTMDVTEDDVRVGVEIVRMCLETVLSEIGKIINRGLCDQYSNDMKRIMGNKANRFMSTEEIIEPMQAYWGTGRSAVINRLRMVKYMFITKMNVNKGDKNIKYYKWR